MRMKKIKHGNFRKIIVRGVVIAGVLSIGILATGIAKHQNMKNIDITKENTLVVYVESEDGSYSKVSDGKIPASGYTLNTDNTKTRCTVSGEIDSNVKISYENGEVKVGEVTKSGTRCYFYFDKVKGITIDEVMAGGTPTDDSMFVGITGNGVYTWTKGDYSGGSQPIKYFRGNVDNNWVVFGKDGSNYIWWRIIRNNSNGSLRMIFAGTNSSKTSAPATTGTETQIGTKAFNLTNNNNMYVGFKYTSGQVNGIGTASTILGDENGSDVTTLYGWYNTKLKTNYGSYIDIDAGFCNDRTPYSGSGIGTTTYYAAQNRLQTNKTPSLLCTDVGDIFKMPVGLITADEVQLSGMIYGGSGNTSSYLYTNSQYWTMSPYFANSIAYLFSVCSYGSLYWCEVPSTNGVRPVINLKSDTLFEDGGTGLANNPYVVLGT